MITERGSSGPHPDPLPESYSELQENQTQHCWRGTEDNDLLACVSQGFRTMGRKSLPYSHTHAHTRAPPLYSAHMPPPPVVLFSAGDSSSGRWDTCLPVCVSPLSALWAPDLLSRTLSAPARRGAHGARPQNGGEPARVDGRMDGGSGVSPWEVSMCARACVCALNRSPPAITGAALEFGFIFTTFIWTFVGCKHACARVCVGGSPGGFEAELY